MASQDTKTLFILPIPKLGDHVGGTLTCTSPAESIYLLTLSSPPDNRLTTATCGALLQALDIIEFDYPKGVLMTTSAIPKFYSNGLDLEHAMTTPGFWSNSIYLLWKRLLTYPMPTVALINGHGFAGGFMTAMHHDYRVQNPEKGFLCLNEVEFGAPLKPAMTSIFRQKLPANLYRDVTLEAKRFGGKAALEAGIVDKLGGLEEALALVAERKLVKKGQSGVYGVIKSEMWRESVALLSKENFDEEERRWNEREAGEAQRQQKATEAVKAWKASQGKAKL